MSTDTKRVVYRLPDMDTVSVRCDLSYKPDRHPDLTMDVYSPRGGKDSDRRPAVLFVHGEIPPRAVPHVKSWGQYVSWGPLAAASGMIGVTFNHRSTERYTTFRDAIEDIDDLIAYVRDNADEFKIDADRLGIWTCSAGAYLGLRAAFHNAPASIRCVVSYYGIMDIGHYRSVEDTAAVRRIPDDLSPLHHLDQHPDPVPPMLLVRAGGDRPQLNATFDWFLTECLARNLDLECMNHSEAPHAFDVLDDSKRSTEIIHRTLEFLTTRLVRELDSAGD